MIIAPVLSQPFIIMYDDELSMNARKLLYFINNIIIQNSTWKHLQIFVYKHNKLRFG